MMLGGMMPPMGRRDGGQGGGEGGFVTGPLHGRDDERADDRRVSHGGAVHAGEDHAHQDVDLGQAAARPPHHLAGQIDQPVGDVAVVHQFAGQQEEGDGDQRRMGDRLVHLVGDRGQRQLTGEDDVDGRRDHHDETDRRAEQNEEEQKYEKN